MLLVGDFKCQEIQPLSSCASVSLYVTCQSPGIICRISIQHYAHDTFPISEETYKSLRLVCRFP